MGSEGSGGGWVAGGDTGSRESAAIVGWVRVVLGVEMFCMKQM